MSSSETVTNSKEKMTSLDLANNYLAVNLHRLLAEENKGNVCFCPFSISTAMAMLLCAAEGETGSEMRAVLGYDTAGMKKGEIASAFEEQMSLLLETPDSCTLLSANSMLSQKDCKVKEGYKQLLAESFKALVSEVDFRNENERAVTQINEWVKEKTNNMIPELVKFLSPETKIVLLNAVYFQGSWLKVFDEEETVIADFYNKGSEGNVSEVDMMNIDEWYFPFYEDETFLALQLPYKGEQVAMIILLPQELDGLESVEAGLSRTSIRDIKKKLIVQRVKVSIPKFRLEYSKEMSTYFQKLGMNRVFSSGAELGAAMDSTDVSVSEIVHKSVLEVNEAGTEASAATALANVMSASTVPEFIVDHPFLFVIYDTRSDLILFMGRVDELSDSSEI